VVASYNEIITKKPGALAARREEIMNLQERFIRQNPEQLVEVIIKYHGNLDFIAEQLGAIAERLNETYAILTLPLSMVSYILSVPNIEYYELPKTVYTQLRRSMSASGVYQVQSPVRYDLTGRGVIVGIIDSGIDYTHPDFRNPDGTTRILYIWDQSVVGTPPQGFRSGQLYTREDINMALASEEPFSVVPEQDFISHGTAVAGIAAGNGTTSGGVERGAAPESDLIIVKLALYEVPGFSRSTDIMRGVKFCIDTAQHLGMPISINISYGTNDGAHDGSSLFEGFLDSESLRWKTVISVAAGNEANTGHHFFGRVQKGQTEYVDISVGDNYMQLFITLWKNFADTFTIELFAPNGQSTGVINQLQPVTHVTVSGVRMVILFGQPTPFTFNQEIYISMVGVSGPIINEIWRLAVTGVDIVDGSFNIWLPLTPVPTRSTRFLLPDVENTVTLPATADRVITVGGYNSLLNTSTAFSGRGNPYGTFGQKPDLVAPAVDILSAKVGGGYDSFTGTSMAAPFVTGSAALMMEWGIVRGNDPFLFGQRVKAFLCRNALRSFAVEYPNSTWGYGTLSLNDTLDDMVFLVQ
jgi:subtilisin family serine protease